PRHTIDIPIQLGNADACPVQLGCQVRRNRVAEPDAFSPYPRFITRTQTPDRGGVIILFDSGLNGLPVPQPGIPVHQRRGGDGFPNVRVGSGYEQTGEAMHLVTAAANRRMVSSSRFALTETRNRAVQGGTEGGRIARTSKPSCCNSAATAQ